MYKNLGGRINNREIQQTNYGEVNGFQVNSGESVRLRLDEYERDTEKFFENQIARERTEKLENVRWLTTSEAAQYLRISISAIKTMVCRGKVRVHKLGRRNRFLREELERLITFPSIR